jgi:hypothetical protein
VGLTPTAAFFLKTYERREKLVVVFVGYKKPLDGFFAQHLGLP